MGINFGVLHKLWHLAGFTSLVGQALCHNDTTYKIWSLEIQFGRLFSKPPICQNKFPAKISSYMIHVHVIVCMWLPGTAAFWPKPHQIRFPIQSYYYAIEWLVTCSLSSYRWISDTHIHTWQCTELTFILAIASRSTVTSLFARRRLQ